MSAELLEYLWQTYGTVWYTDEDSPEYAYDYMMLLKNIRERNDVWEHILLDYWKTAYPDHWDENLEARLNLTRPAFEKSRPSLTAMSRITSSRVYAQFIQHCCITEASVIFLPDSWQAGKFTYFCSRRSVATGLQQ